jgi:sugar diacid utilization regulator
VGKPETGFGCVVHPLRVAARPDRFVVHKPGASPRASTPTGRGVALAWEAVDSLGPLTSLIRVAVHSDDPGRLIAEAGLLARRPLALVGPHGEELGHVPAGSEGHRALAVARAAARNRLVGAAGWRIVALRRGASSLGFLAVGAARGEGAEGRALMDLLPELIGEQLHCMALVQSHREAFVRRLVSDPHFGIQEARREAGDLGLGLTDSYWPGILTWHGTAPPLPAMASVARDALGRATGSLAALLHRRIVLLYPYGAGNGDADRAEPFAWLAEAVAQARTLAPSLVPQAIAAEAPVELDAISGEVARLDALRRLGPRVARSQPVVPLRAYGLESLLWDRLDAASARRFVDEQLGRLIAWDRARQTDLLSVLEAALDFPRHDQAASRCFMHRNTFRHRLQQAGEVLGATLDDPDERLAVHVALKLHRLVAALDERAAAAPAAAAGDVRWAERRSANGLTAPAPRGRA